MKLCTYLNKNRQERAGLCVMDEIHDLQNAANRISLPLPAATLELLEGGDRLLETARKVERSIIEEKEGAVEKPLKLLAPVPHPPSVRDGYAFRQHVEAARRNRGMPMVPEFDQFPIFYFTNHRGIIGPGEVVVERDHLEQLDFELEAAVIIGRKGKNIPAEKADFYIAGYTIMNDFSARLLQMEEMKLNLGPAKGKDFATALGPWLVTPDELEGTQVTGPQGSRHRLRMTASHNGRQVSEGNLADMNWTFAQIIERASYGVELLPGDVIGSGTVGTGCYMELNGTGALEAKKSGVPFTPVWLEAGDTIELEIERLGKLSNRITAARSDYSIRLKK